MRRRDFITLLGCAVASSPSPARAQQTGMPVIGYLHFGSPTMGLAGEFRKHLSQAGYIEGRNVAIEFRFGNDQNVQLRDLAADLVRSQVAVIVATNDAAALAAKAATSTIPIVFVTGLDPVKRGLVASLSRPGGNITGVALLSSALVSKQLDLLHEMVPGATTFGYLSDPRTHMADEVTSDLAAASRALGWQLVVAEPRSASDIRAAFATFVQRGTAGVVVAPHQLFVINSNFILGLASRNRIPAIYFNSGWVRSGGLMSYGPTETA